MVGLGVGRFDSIMCEQVSDLCSSVVPSLNSGSTERELLSDAWGSFVVDSSSHILFFKIV
jgi:hypothetical protein